QRLRDAIAGHRMGAGAETSRDDDRVHESEPVRLDALDRVAHRVGRMALRGPAERLQAGDVVAGSRHVAGPAAVAARAADALAGSAGRGEPGPRGSRAPRL